MFGVEFLKNGSEIKQVTQGHNIVADGWAGASNPQPHPNTTPLQHTHTYTNCGIINARFSRFRLEHDDLNMADKQTNGPTSVRWSRWTDGWTKPLIELRVRN